LYSPEPDVLISSELNNRLLFYLQPVESYPAATLCCGWMESPGLSTGQLQAEQNYFLGRQKH